MAPARMEKLLAKLEQGQQVTIVALGDSNTELTFHTRGHLNWSLLLQEALFEKYGPNKVILINAAHCGESASTGLKRMPANVFRFQPDLLIVGYYWEPDPLSAKQIIEQAQQAGIPEILLRTPNPVVAPNMPPVNPPVQASQEWPGSTIGAGAKAIVALGLEMNIPVCDHYTAWMNADASHDGPPVSNPNKLWMRMADALHPGPLGHLAFYRELAPFFNLPTKLSWEH